MRRLLALGVLAIATAGTARAQQAVPASAANSPAAADTMPAAVAQRFVDAANARDAGAMAALVAPGAVFARFPDGAIVAQGRDSIRAMYAHMMPTLPAGFRITVDPRVVEGHLVIDQEHFPAAPGQQGRATWMYLVQGGLIQRAWVLDGRPVAP